MKKNLEQLMKQAVAGDQQSYRTLLNTINPMLQNFFRKRVSDALQCEDLTQETLLAIHKVRHTFDPGRSFKSWMYAIAHYKMTDYFRKWGRVNKHEIYAQAFIDDIVDKSVKLDSRLVIEEIRATIEKLPPKQRHAVELAKFRGLSIKEVSQMMNISESAVKVNVSRGLQALKTALKEKGYEN